jgi:hypothetical protein
VRDHLDRHPEDWVGAYAAFRSAVASVVGTGDADPLAVPPGLEWYARREAMNAEPLVRDDIPILTAEVVDESAIAASRVELRFSCGTRSMGIFARIAEHLAALRGTRPDTIEGASHALYLQPDLAAAYITSHAG